MPIIVLSFAIILIAGLLMGYSMLKRTRKAEEWGCLTYLAFLLGIALVLFLLWPSPSTLVEWLMVVGALVLFVSVVSLAATGWRTLLAPYVKRAPVTSKRPRKGTANEKELDEQFAAETFEGAFSMNPVSLMNRQFSVGGIATGNSDPFDSCLGSILIGLLVALSYLGVLLSYLLSTFLMPRPASPPRRVLRTGLSFLYAAVIFAGALWFLKRL